MTALASSVASALVQYFEESKEKVHKWVNPVSTEQLWEKPYGYGNSIGHLLLHMTGNLNDRIGGQIAGTGYQRDRNREFTDTDKKPKEELLESFDRAISMTIDTIQKQTPEDWSAPYSAKTGPPARDRLAIFVRCLAHTHMHMGQIIYLSKEFERRATAS